MRFFFFVLACLWLVAVPRSARADGEARGRTSSLSWVRLPGAESCVATQALARAVEERLGREVFVSAAQADVSVEGRIEPKRGGWHSVLTLRDAKGALLGTRELDRPEPSCDSMTQPVALVIAVMIDPDAAMGKREPAKKEEPKVETKIVIQREEVPVPVPVPAPPPPLLRFEGSVALAGSVGLLPNPGIGVGAFGMIEPRRSIPFIGSGTFWFDSKANADGSAGVGASTAFSAFILGAGLCPLWHSGAVAHLYACLGGHLGVMRAHPMNYTPAKSDEDHVVWDGALTLRATIVIQKPFILRGGIEGIVPILRESYTFSRADGQQTELFRMSPVAAMADLGVGLELP